MSRELLEKAAKAAGIRGESRSTFATVDWLDGWLDCNEAPEEDRKEFPE